MLVKKINEVQKMADTPLEGKGKITKKEEALKKDGSKFLKFVIEGKSTEGHPLNNTFSMFDYETGNAIGIGDEVAFSWTETPGTLPGGSQITYRNLVEIARYAPPAQSELPAAPVKDMARVDNYQAKEANKYSLGMAINATALIMQACADKCETIECVKDMLKENSEYFDKLTKALYLKYTRIRKEELGY